MGNEVDKEVIEHKKGVLTLRIPDKTVMALVLAVGSLVWGRVEQYLVGVQEQEQHDKHTDDNAKLQGAQATVYKLMANRMDELFERVEANEDDLEGLLEFVDRKHAGKPTRAGGRRELDLGGIGHGGGSTMPKPAPIIEAEPEVEVEAAPVAMESAPIEEPEYQKAVLPDFDDVIQQKVSEEFVKKKVKEVRKKK
jgi:hypothetical protein